LHQFKDNDESKINNQIIKFCYQIASKSNITAINTLYDSIVNKTIPLKAKEVIIIIKDYQPRVTSTIKIIEDQTISFLAVDQWIFKRDIDRGFLGEVFASSLVVPYKPIIGKEFLHQQEIILKKRLTLELLQNLVQSFPELSHQLKIKPKYFMYKVLLDRIRLFPPLYYSLSNFLTSPLNDENRSVLKGYIEALQKLMKENKIKFSENNVTLNKDFINKSKNPKIYFNNFRKKTPRTLFTSVFSVWSNFLSLFYQKTRILPSIKNFYTENNLKKKTVNPQKYVLIKTNSRSFSLADGINMLTFAKKYLKVDEKKIKIEAIGGVLNDVHLIKSSSNQSEKTIIVKRFRDWTGFKWFPLSLWSLGARSISVLGRTRLAKECEFNSFLNSKDFNVPKILHVSHKNRLIFMEFIEGEDLSQIIKKFMNSSIPLKNHDYLSLLQNVGKLFAKIHENEITLGDTKPENIIINSDGKIYLLDFEQASFGGDKSWDIAVFLYFIGHYLSPIYKKELILSLVNAFLSGYIINGGNIQDIRKVSKSKYTRVFSILIMPSFIALISNMCKKIDS
jgi:Kae1-associated kinase Bud32